jgi:hypothetical protein
MMNKFQLVSRRLTNKLLFNSLKVLGVCSACFMIEACYGVPQTSYPDTPKDIDVSGTIKSEKGMDLGNVPVLLTSGKYSDTLHTVTDEKGNYIFYDVKSSKEIYHLLIKNKSGISKTLDFAITEKDMMANKKTIDLTLKSE